VGRHERRGNTSGSSVESPIVKIARFSMVILVALGVIAGVLIPLYYGGVKMVTGDYIPGIIMLLFAGFVLLFAAGWFIRRYQAHLLILGIFLLAIMGFIWAIFEDGYLGKAFMLLLVVTAGSVGALGFYNMFIAKRQPRMSG
jgi:FtsH-binding integral membrane protein